MDLYDGTTDPSDHLVFEYALAYKGSTKPLTCWWKELIDRMRIDINLVTMARWIGPRATLDRKHDIFIAIDPEAPNLKKITTDPFVVHQDSKSYQGIVPFQGRRLRQRCKQSRVPSLAALLGNHQANIRSHPNAPTKSSISLHVLFNKLRILHSHIIPHKEVLIRFVDDHMTLLGYILAIYFLVLKSYPTYNAIIGYPTLNALGTVVTTMWGLSRDKIHHVVVQCGFDQETIKEVKNKKLGRDSRRCFIDAPIMTSQGGSLSRSFTMEEVSKQSICYHIGYEFQHQPLFLKSVGIFQVEIGGVIEKKLDTLTRQIESMITMKDLKQWRLRSPPWTPSWSNGFKAHHQSKLTIILKKLPPNLKDLRSFTIPCTIGNSHFKRALCDLGASINLMSFSMDILAKVEKFIFHVYFVVLNMEEFEDLREGSNRGIGSKRTSKRKGKTPLRKC
ncbi:hypothetical protein CR513_29426, partial [Mucuna pruriens]